MHAKLDGKFWVRHLAVPFFLFFAAAIFCEVTDVDLVLADRFFDFSAGVWPARHSFWAEWLIHQRGKELIILITAGSFAGWLASWRWQCLRRDRWSLLFLALVIVLSTTSVALMKKGIGRHCPWDVTRYGGSVPYTRLTEPPPQACAPGNCFPAGHASGGFALFAGYFAWRDRRRRLALSSLAAGGVLGSIYAYGQMARGAHFLSHNFYSAIICWLIPLFLYLPYRYLLRAPRAEAPLPAAPPVVAKYSRGSEEG
ncbi:phosphatase PAP2 family protein [Geomonas oryzae]|uniref:phosphatase PAP2 family protein n=1 Tax=Geomonas oryzae TaxID=2364273 RepID=UPI00100A616C|nr:phosphatase PAP2 family protein [Geomonas oryzae]